MYGRIIPRVAEVAPIKTQHTIQQGMRPVVFGPAVPTMSDKEIVHGEFEYPFQLAISAIVLRMACFRMPVSAKHGQLRGRRLTNRLRWCRIPLVAAPPKRNAQVLQHRA